jgi:plastocyanin
VSRSIQSRSWFQWPRAAVAGALVAALAVTAVVPGAPPSRTVSAEEQPLAGHAHAGHAAGGHAAAAYGISDSSAATLRVTLNKLLAEHVYLAARATGAALGGQMPAFEAAAAALDGNSVDLSNAIGAAYGEDAEKAFLPLWRAHIGMVVDYTQGLATDDQAKKDRAVADLDGYRADADAFFSGANENLPPGAVAELLKPHVMQLAAIADAQKARDQGRVYSELRMAIAHTHMIADPLAQATAAKFPGTFAGDPMTPAVSYRVAVNNLLAEHVFLASSATLGGISGNQAQFTAAAAELDGNSIDLSRGIGAAYGAEAEAAFLPIWRSHIGMLVDYTVGKATDDLAKQDQAVADLVQYTQDFAAFLNAANENLPQPVVADLLAAHVVGLKDMVDAQKAGDQTKQFMEIRMAAGHMSMIADPLAEATVTKFSDRFAGAGTGAAPATMAMTAEIRQFAYRPSPLQVEVGEAVTWTNEDGAPHSVTHRGGAFDSGLFGQGQSYSFTFAEPGEYAYYCTRHPSMQGMVMVS